MIKINGTIYDTVAEEMIKTLTLEELRVIAIDTVNWHTGISIRRDMDNNNILLSAANSKAIALVAKALWLKDVDISMLTELEQSAICKIVEIGETDYTDSEMLNGSLGATASRLVDSDTTKAKIANALSKEEIVEILGGLE